jgi:hypothetical protein
MPPIAYPFEAQNQAGPKPFIIDNSHLQLNSIKINANSRTSYEIMGSFNPCKKQAGFLSAQTRLIAVVTGLIMYTSIQYGT